MLSSEIMRVFRRIESKSGPKAKSMIMSDYIKDPEMREVLKMTLSPFITFGIGQSMLSQVKEDLEDFEFGSGNFTDETWELLEKLANRELTGDAARKAIYDEELELNEESVELLDRILLKDLSIGASK